MRAVIGDQGPVFIQNEEGPLWRFGFDIAVVEAVDRARFPEVVSLFEVALISAALALTLAFRRVRAVPDEVVLGTASEALHDATIWSSGVAPFSFAHGAASLAFPAGQGGDTERALVGSG